MRPEEAEVSQTPGFSPPRIGSRGGSSGVRLTVLTRKKETLVFLIISLWIPIIKNMRDKCFCLVKNT